MCQEQRWHVGTGEFVMIDRRLIPEEIKMYFSKFDAYLKSLCLTKEFEESTRTDYNFYNYYVPGFLAPVAKLGLYVHTDLSDDGINKEKWCVELQVAIKVSLVTKKIVSAINTEYVTDLLVERTRTYQEEWFEEGLKVLKRMLPIYKQLTMEAKQIELKRDFI